jgi:potassium-transporting ATPase KdpC subunit
MFKPVLPALRVTIVLAVVSGIFLPLMVAGIAKIIFPNEANGSLIHRPDGQVLGSALIGQMFVKPEYFHPRPSAAGAGYAAEASSGTNLGPTSTKLIEGAKDFPSVEQLAENYKQVNQLAPSTSVPVDAVTRSGSGLDPHISPENAFLQVGRVAKARHISEVVLTDLVEEHIEKRQLGFLGEPRVNVLLLNLAVEKLKS